jgi:hypothetical protein
VSLTGTDFPEVFATDMRNPKLPRLDQVDGFPALYRDAALNIAAAVRQEGLNPSEYLTEVRVEEAGHILRFELWHESVVGAHYDPGTKGDPSHKCRTVLYDSVKGAVTSISGWR